MRLTAIVVSLGFCALANAEVLTLGDVKARNGVQLSAADLTRLMPDAKVIHHTVAGSTRRWNNGEGKFVASSDGMGLNMGSFRGGTGQGTWRIDDERGTYCVTIDWARTREAWCRYIFKVSDKYYNFDKLDDNTERSGELEFSN